MNLTPDVGVTTSIDLSIGSKEPITLTPSRAHGDAHLVIGDRAADIRLERTHVHALHDQIHETMAVLGQVDEDNAACDKATEAARRATNAATVAADAARRAEQAGDVERVSKLRAAAEQARITADAVDAAVRAVDNAASVADDAAEYAVDLAAGRTLGDEQAG